jgi:chemotaxis protein MotB
MARKKKEAPAGAPDWMVTYGDMMTLLLCFFVILVSMSEIKQDQKFQDVMESIKRAFGYQGGVGNVPARLSTNNSFDKQMTELVMKKWQLQIGKSTDEGIQGENPSVKKVREGLEYTIGGQVSFEIGKAKLLDSAKNQLEVFVEGIRGMNNKIRIRGHSSRIPAQLYHPYENLDDLSFARAVAVKEYLINQLQLRPERVTVEACGDNEPLRSQAYDNVSRAINDRVSIIVTEALVNDFQGERASDTNNILDG